MLRPCVCSYGTLLPLRAHSSDSSEVAVLPKCQLYELSRFMLQADQTALLPMKERSLLTR